MVVVGCLQCMTNGLHFVNISGSWLRLVTEINRLSSNSLAEETNYIMCVPFKTNQKRSGDLNAN